MAKSMAHFLLEGNRMKVGAFHFIYNLHSFKPVLEFVQQEEGYKYNVFLFFIVTDHGVQ